MYNPQYNDRRYNVILFITNPHHNQPHYHKACYNEILSLRNLAITNLYNNEPRYNDSV